MTSPVVFLLGWTEYEGRRYERVDGLEVRRYIDGSVTIGWKTVEQQQVNGRAGFLELWRVAGEGDAGFTTDNSVHWDFGYPVHQLKLKDVSAFLAAAHKAIPQKPTLAERVAALELRIAALEAK